MEAWKDQRQAQGSTQHVGHGVPGCCVLHSVTMLSLLVAATVPFSLAWGQMPLEEHFLSLKGFGGKPTQLSHL